MMGIRWVMRSDIPRLVELAASALLETRYARYPLDAEKVKALIHRAVDDQEIVVLVSVDADNVAQGFLAGVITEHYFLQMRYATNIALYVAPTLRGSRCAARLIREFERVARALGANEVMLGATSGSHMSRTAAFYDALGYQLVGAVTVKYMESNHVG